MNTTRPGMGAGMHRRQFLALAGIAGSGGAGLALAARAPELPSLGATEQAPPEQPDLPSSGTHRVIWNVDTTEPLAALTFDDGPDPAFTPEILAILERAGVRATFFMMGWNAVTNPELARAVVDAGHEIGNHTWTHLNLAFTSPEETLEEIHRGADEIESVTGVRPRWFRPPRGQLSGFTIRHASLLGTDTVIWSVTRGVPGSGTPEAVRRHLAENLGPGDIVDLHDGLGRGTFNPGRQFTEDLIARRRVEVDALPGVIEDATARGLRLGSVSDLVAAERPSAGVTRPVHPAAVPDPLPGGTGT